MSGQGAHAPLWERVIGGKRTAWLAKGSLLWFMTEPDLDAFVLDEEDAMSLVAALVQEFDLTVEVKRVHR